MANRNDFDDFFGDDEEAPVADTRADGRLYRVPLNRVSWNLVNPRTDFGTEDQLIDLGKSLARRQNQPCPVVSRNAYLKLWPDHADRIGDVDYVLVSGERRYRAATAVGLTALDCVANDGFAADRRTFMEAVVSENVDRQNFDPVEEAYAVQALVTEFGSNRAVAQHFERADGWVTQRILLTHLASEIQHLVRQKVIPLEAARSLGKLARDKQWQASQQFEWWAQEQGRRQARREEATAARSAARRTTQQAPLPTATPPAAAAHSQGAIPAVPAEPSFTAVKPDPPAAAEGVDSRRSRREGIGKPDPQQHAEAAPTGAPRTDTEPVRDSVPEPRVEVSAVRDPAAGDRKPVMFPYDDGAFAAQLLIHRMPEDEFDTMMGRLAQHQQQRSSSV